MRFDRVTDGSPSRYTVQEVGALDLSRVLGAVWRDHHGWHAECRRCGQVVAAATAATRTRQHAAELLRVHRQVCYIDRRRS